MSATFEQHDGCTTLISDAGRDRLAAEQRLAKIDPLYTKVNLTGAGGAVIAIAWLVIRQIKGT
jgi:hypothetical protein